MAEKKIESWFACVTPLKVEPYDGDAITKLLGDIVDADDAVIASNISLEYAHAFVDAVNAATAASKG
jgi:hypothetical protein